MKSLPIAEYFSAELVQKIEAHNAAMVQDEADLAANSEHDADLLNPATVTPANAKARLHAIAGNKAERFALLAKSRELAEGALALLAEVQTAGQAETLRLVDASARRQKELRDGLAALHITEELAVVRAQGLDAELNSMRIAANQIAQGTARRAEVYRDEANRLDNEIRKTLGG